jgi:hypothetical protein
VGVGKGRMLKGERDYSGDSRTIVPHGGKWLRSTLCVNLTIGGNNV